MNEPETTGCLFGDYFYGGNTEILKGWRTERAFYSASPNFFPNFLFHDRNKVSGQSQVIIVDREPLLTLEFYRKSLGESVSQIEGLFQIVTMQIFAKNIYVHWRVADLTVSLKRWWAPVIAVGSPTLS